MKTNTYSHKFSFRLEITLVKLYLPTEDFQKRNDATENGPRELALLQAGFLLYIGSGIIAVGVKLRCDATIRNFETQCRVVLCTKSGLTLIGMSYESKKNAHL